MTYTALDMVDAPWSPSSVDWCWWPILLQIWWRPPWSPSSVDWCWWPTLVQKIWMLPWSPSSVDCWWCCWWHILLLIWWMTPWSPNSVDWCWCCWWPILLQIWWISHGLLAVLIGGGVVDDLYCCYVAPLISLYKEYFENLNLKIKWFTLTMNHFKK